jgi:hypothetical protein
VVVTGRARLASNNFRIAARRTNQTDRIGTKEETMNPKHLFVAVPVALIVLGNGVATAGKTIDHEGTMACIVDKWDEKEPEKGHKLVDYVSRCILIPNDPGAPKATEECAGKFEYMPDKSWKGSGTCTDTYKGGDKMFLTWEEGSHLKEYTYQNTGGTGQYKGASGGGTYFYEPLTDTLFGGWFKGKIVLP